MSRRLVVLSVLVVAVSAAAAAAEGVLEPGEVLRGRLSADDPSIESGEYYDLYELEVEGEARVRIELRSEDFDTYLGAFDRAGIDVENDDADGTNSELDFTTEGPTRVSVVVTSYAPGETGDYELLATLSYTDADAEDEEEVVLLAEPELAGRLEPGDRTLASGEYVDILHFTGARNQSVSISLESDDFDTYLILDPPESDQVDVDDSRGSTNSHLDLLLPESGIYRVLVTSYAVGERGDYRLRWAVGNSGPRQYVGLLSDADPTLDAGEYYREYTFSANAGERVVLDLVSEDFDGYLVLASPTRKSMIHNDDRDPDDLNPRIETVLEESGLYTVFVTTYGPGETGSFRLSIETEGILGLAPGMEQAGTYYGLFVGISDYPGATNDLPYCRDDALKLADVFVTGGIIEPENRRSLTDAEATRERLIGELGSLTRRMGPEDTLVLFYSGHGVVKPSETERDGSDEYLSLYDGDLGDDELADLLSETEGRVLLVFDACYSAGFGKDVLTREGWFGVFSSEEDVPSFVAERFQAGGYLSFFFQRSVEGEADGTVTDRRDGYISMGELQRYLFESWYSDEGPDSATNQHLRFERNGVSIEELLFRSPLR